MMNVSDLSRVNHLVARRERMLWILKELNAVNGGDQFGIPSEVLEFVDAKLAAKGLISLLIESLRDTESKIVNLGVKLDNLKSEAA
jgi:hypothetical protein